MHAVARHGPVSGLLLMLLAPSGHRVATVAVGVLVVYPDFSSSWRRGRATSRLHALRQEPSRNDFEPRDDPPKRVAKLIENQEVQ